MDGLPPGEATAAELEAEIANVTAAAATLGIDNEAQDPNRHFLAQLNPLLQGLSSAALVRLADDIGTGQRGALTS